MTQQERSRKARQKWRGLISEQARSGQGVAAFCREQRLCIPHFYWWKKRLRAEAWPASTGNGGEAAKGGGAGRFVEVKLATKGSGLLGRAPEPRGSEGIFERLHRSATRGWVRRLQRSGGRQRHYPRGLLVARETKVRGGGAGRAGDRTGSGSADRHAVRRGTTSQRSFRGRTSGAAPGTVCASVGWVAREAAGMESATAAQASHGRSGQLRAEPVDRTACVLHRWRGTDGQQRFRTGDEASRAPSEKFSVRRQPARWPHCGDSRQPGFHLPSPRSRSTALPHATVGEPAAVAFLRAPLAPSRTGCLAPRPVEASPRHPHRRPAKQSGSTYRRRICLVNVIPHPHTNLCLTHRSHTAGSPPRGGSAAPTPNSGTGSAPPPDGKALGSLLRLEDLHRSELCNGYDGSIARQTRQDHVSQVSNRSVAS